MSTGLFAIAQNRRAIPLAGSSALSPRAPVHHAADDAYAPAGQFIAGPENALVRIVAESLLERGPHYNPIVFYGPGGVGKTTLVHALLQQRAGALSLTAADFGRGYANAVDTDSLSDWRDRFDRCECLVIDDLQRLATKPAAQQELLHTIDRLVDRGTPFVATLAALPHDTPGLARGLVSRLSAGLIVPLVAPQTSTRQAIIEQIAASLAIELPAPLVERLANPPAALAPAFATAPQLRSALLKLASRTHDSQRVIDDALVDELFAEHAPDAKAAVRQIATAVARQYGLPVAELRGQSRKQAVVQARSVAMHLCRQVTGGSFAAIGRAFGGRDHTTVLHACRRIDALLAADAALRRLVDDLLATFARTPLHPTGGKA